MKILIITSWYPPILSGSSLWAESLVLALRKRGHDVRVVTTRWQNYPETKAADYPIYYLDAWLLPRMRLLLNLPLIPIAYSRKNKKKLRALIREFRPDIIHQINHIFDTALLSAYAARKEGVPLVGSITTPIQSQSAIIHGLMRLLDRAILYRLAIKHWRRVICGDAEQERYVIESYGKWVTLRQFCTIMLGIHSKIKPSPQLVKPTSPQIVTIGHVHEARNPSNIIRAMPLVLQKFPTAQLTIAGRIQLEEPVAEVKRLGLENAVRFLGEIQPQQVADLLAVADVFVILHQMRYAGLSFTAMEAMSLGVPVVINAPPHIYGENMPLQDEEILLIDGRNVSQIAETIIRLLSDPEYRQRIGTQGQQFVKTFFSWDRCAEQTELLYQLVLKEA